MDQHIKMDEAMDRVKKALGDEGYLKVMANLYGPLVRRVLGMEDLLLAIVNVKMISATEEATALRALGFHQQDNGDWVKTE